MIERRILIGLSYLKSNVPTVLRDLRGFDSDVELVTYATAKVSIFILNSVVVS